MPFNDKNPNIYDSQKVEDEITKSALENIKDESMNFPLKKTVEVLPSLLFCSKNAEMIFEPRELKPFVGHEMILKMPPINERTAGQR